MRFQVRVLSIRPAQTRRVLKPHGAETGDRYRSATRPAELRVIVAEHGKKPLLKDGVVGDLKRVEPLSFCSLFSVLCDLHSVLCLCLSLCLSVSLSLCLSRSIDLMWMKELTTALYRHSQGGDAELHAVALHGESKAGPAPARSETILRTSHLKQSRPHRITRDVFDRSFSHARRVVFRPLI